MPDAVVIDGNERLAGDLAASVSEAGYSTRIARTGIDGFEIAVNSVPCSIVFVHASTGQWDVSGTVANLRADARTKTTPIIIYGRSILESQANDSPHDIRESGTFLNHCSPYPPSQHRHSLWPISCSWKEFPPRIVGR